MEEQKPLYPIKNEFQIISGKKRRVCSFPSCSNICQKNYLCKRHADPMKRKICTYDGCTSDAINSGFCLDHGATTNGICNSDGCTTQAKKGGFCTKHGGVVLCKHDGCEFQTKYNGFCITHGGYKTCSRDGCCEKATKKGLCFTHGGYDICIVDGCEGPARHGPNCKKHRSKYAAPICSADGCSRISSKQGLCAKHGEVCSVDGCDKQIVNNGVCISHGAERKTCSMEDCDNRALSRKCPIHALKKDCVDTCTPISVCASHGARPRCSFSGCARISNGGDLCRKHQKNTTCSISECRQDVARNGLCATHAPARKKIYCSYPDCDKWATGRMCEAHELESECVDSCALVARCRAHGARAKKCSYTDCTELARVKGFCAKHGGKYYCTVEWCTNVCLNNGKCIKHGASARRCSAEACSNFEVNNGVCLQHGAVLKRCDHAGCEKRARVGGMCHDHNPDYRCAKCGIVTVYTKGALCSGRACGRLRRTKEYKMAERVIGAFSEYGWNHDKILETRCKKYRPDLWLELPDRLICIECDENQHLDYDCDMTRMFNIHQMVYKPTIFVRFNPDKHEKKASLETRLQELINTVRQYLEMPTDGLKVGFPMVEYLYYDAANKSRAEEEFASIRSENNLI